MAVGPVSPRRQIYEAKFEKYVTNKQQKNEIELRAYAMEKPKFDVIRSKSPSKNRCGLPVSKERPKYDPEDLIPEGYEDHLMREGLLKKRNADPFKLLGVSNEDKMSFYLLKWIFNAIKLDSDANDKQL